jgi:ubiquinone biosynthesis protein
LISEIFRLIRVGWVLGRYDAILPREYQGMLPPVVGFLGRILRLGSDKLGGDPGTRMAAALENLGPAWIKFGQFLATRPDIVGEQAARGLSRLKDRLAPFSDEQANACLVSAFGDDVARLFWSIGFSDCGGLCRPGP